MRNQQEMKATTEVSRLRGVFPDQSLDLALVDRADPLVLHQITSHCVLLAGRERDFTEFKIYVCRRLALRRICQLSRGSVKSSRRAIIGRKLLRVLRPESQIPTDGHPARALVRFVPQPPAAYHGRRTLRDSSPAGGSDDA
jgi:hypothetical protein